MPLQRSNLGKYKIDRDVRQLRTRLNIQGVASGPSTDHGLLLGLADDDHAQYVHLSAARSITGQHSFDPLASQAPFLLDVNAQGQTVTGFKADQLNKSILSSGLGLSGGGGLTTNQTITLTSSSDPLSTEKILATSSAGFLKLRRLGIGIAPGMPLHVVDVNAPQVRIGYNTTNYLNISINASGDATYDVSGTTPQHLFTDPLIITNATSPQFAAKYDSSNYLTLSIDVNANATFSTIGTQASLILNPAGDVVMDPVGDDVLPLTSYDINLGTLTKKYLTIHAAELWVQTLVALEVMATIGGRVLVGPTTVLAEDLSGTILLLNGGFENRTGDNFDNWTEDEGVDGSQITAETTGPYEGSTFVRLTAGTSGEAELDSDPFAVNAGESYFLDFWYNNSSTPAGVSITATCTSGGGGIATKNWPVSVAVWTYGWMHFVIPTGCTEMRLLLFCPSTNNEFVDFDAMQLYRDTITVEHNQMDDNDTVVLESAGKIEAIKVNDFQIVGGHTTGYFLLSKAEAISDDDLLLWPNDSYFQVRGSTGNDGQYQVFETNWIGGDQVQIIVYGTVPHATMDGYIAYSMPDPSGPYTYHRCQRARDGTPVNDWIQGDAVFNTGNIGDGYIDLYSVSGLHSGVAYGPTIAGMIRLTEGDFPGSEERWAIGNLNGMYGYAADEYGAAFGLPNGTRITIEPTSGVSFYANNILTGQILTAGGFWFGNSSTTSRLVFNTTNGLQLFNSSNQRVLKVGLTGEFYIGTSVTTERLTWDSTNGMRIFNAANTAVLSVPVSGAVEIVGQLNVTGTGRIDAGGAGTARMDPDGFTIFTDQGVYTDERAFTFKHTSGLPGGTNSPFGWIRGNQQVDPFIANGMYMVAADADGGSNIAAISVGSEETIPTHFTISCEEIYSSAGKAYFDGIFFIEDDTNTDMTYGITINQLNSVKEILAFKSSDIAHGITGSADTETDTFGVFKKNSGTLGGLQIRGYGDPTYQVGIHLVPIAGIGTTVSGTSAIATFNVSSFKKSGTSKVALSSAENIAMFSNGGLTRWILKGDGEIHSDFHTGGGTGHANYDDYNDAQLLRAFDIKHSSLEIADTWFNKNLQTLQDLGIIHDVRPDGMFVSQQKITKLQIGAIWQLYNRIEALENKLKEIL